VLVFEQLQLPTLVRSQSPLATPILEALYGYVCIGPECRYSTR
jgi:hypothetical protein